MEVVKQCDIAQLDLLLVVNVSFRRGSGNDISTRIHIQRNLCYVIFQINVEKWSHKIGGNEYWFNKQGSEVKVKLRSHITSWYLIEVVSNAGFIEHYQNPISFVHIYCELCCCLVVEFMVLKLFLHIDASYIYE